MNIENKVIVITGGGRGLGKAMAECLARRGARLAIVDIDPDAAANCARHCAELGAQVKAFEANVTDEEAVVKLFDDVAADLGPVDALVNNAGIIRDGFLVKVKGGEVIKRMSLQDWQAVIDVNLTGVFLCGREAATHMVRAGSGTIINISSISEAGNAGQSNYAAAKAGVHALTVTWAKELSRHGVRVAGVAPGFTATDMVASMKPEALQKMASRIPAQRLAKPEEIAHTIVYILENDYVNGRVLPVDGGLRL